MNFPFPKNETNADMPAFLSGRTREYEERRLLNRRGGIGPPPQ